MDQTGAHLWSHLGVTIARVFIEKGVTFQDLASLQIKTLEKWCGGPCPAALLDLREASVREHRATLQIPFEWVIRSLLPMPDASRHPKAGSCSGNNHTTSNRLGSVIGAGPAKRGKWVDPSKGRVDLKESDFKRRILAARKAIACLVDVVSETKFMDEFSYAVSSNRRLQWEDLFVDMIAKKYDSNTIEHALRCWRRWLRWRSAQPFPLAGTAACPMMLDVACFLNDVSRGGPTAAKSVWHGMQWLVEQLGFVGLPLVSPLLVTYSHQSLGSSISPMANELPLKVWVHLLGIAKEGSGSFALFCSLALYIVVAALRYKHAQRHSFLFDRSTSRTLFGRVWRGKTRHGQAFYVAVPTYVEPGVPLFAWMASELRQHNPEAQFLVPDFKVVLAKGVIDASDVIRKPMAYNKFAG